MVEAPLSLERYAEAAVYRREYSATSVGPVLQRLGTSLAEVEAAAAYWGRAFAEGLAQGDPTSVLRFAHVYGRIEHRVRLYRPSPDEVRPEPIPAPSARKPRLTRRAMRPLTSASAASAEVASQPLPAPKDAPEHLPSYLRDQLEERGAEKRPLWEGVAIRDLDPDVTAPVDSRLVRRGATNGAVPFERDAPVKTPAPLPLVEEQSGETSFGTVATIGGASEAGSTLPGAGASSPGSASGLPLSIERFAQIQAALARSSEQSVVLQRFGIEPHQWAPMARRVADAMNHSAPLRAQYQQLYRVALSHER